MAAGVNAALYNNGARPIHAADLVSPTAEGTWVSPVGISTGTSVLPNGGLPYGPDTPGTSTNGLQEALNANGSIHLTGTCVTNNPVKMNPKNKIYGDGIFTSVIKAGASWSGVSLITTQTSTATGSPNNFVLMNLDFDANLQSMSGAVVDLASNLPGNSVPSQETRQETWVEGIRVLNDLNAAYSLDMTYNEDSTLRNSWGPTGSNSNFRVKFETVNGACWISDCVIGCLMTWGLAVTVQNSTILDHGVILDDTQALAATCNITLVNVYFNGVNDPGTNFSWGNTGAATFAATLTTTNFLNYSTQATARPVSLNVIDGSWFANYDMGSFLTGTSVSHIVPTFQSVTFIYGPKLGYKDGDTAPNGHATTSCMIFPSGTFGNYYIAPGCTFTNNSTQTGPSFNLTTVTFDMVLSQVQTAAAAISATSIGGVSCNSGIILTSDNPSSGTNVGTSPCFMVNGSSKPVNLKIVGGTVSLIGIYRNGVNAVTWFQATNSVCPVLRPGDGVIVTWSGQPTYTYCPAS